METQAWAPAGILSEKNQGSLSLHGERTGVLAHDNTYTFKRKMTISEAFYLLAAFMLKDFSDEKMIFLIIK